MLKRFLMAIVLLASSTAVGRSQPTTRLQVSAESRLWIEGASNVSRWSCRATRLAAAIDVDSGAGNTVEMATHLRAVTVQVPVADLTCGNPRMEKSLRTSLKADESNANAYVLARLDAVTTESTDRPTIHAVGTLTLAGRDNMVSLEIDASNAGSDGVQAQGEIPILMSDYGVTPPTALFGVIRCVDRVVVKFALKVAPLSGAAVGAASSY